MHLVVKSMLVDVSVYRLSDELKEFLDIYLFDVILKYMSVNKKDV